MGCIYSSVSGWDLFWEAYAAIEVRFLAELGSVWAHGGMGGGVCFLSGGGGALPPGLDNCTRSYVGRGELSVCNWQPLFHPIENETA